jgi:hypothetical protein
MKDERETEVLRSTGEMGGKRGLFPVVLRRLVGVALLCAATLIIFGWVGEQNNEFNPVLYKDLEVNVGKIELIKPWKTTPYIVLNENGRDLIFSCYGPYKRNYWCADIDSPKAMNGDVYTIKSNSSNNSNNKYVYEISSNGETIVDFDKQVQRFSDAISQGPAYIKLMAAIFIVFIAIGVFFKN